MFEDDGTRVTINGVEITGWKAKLIVLLMLGILIGIGFSIGWNAAVQNACVRVAA